MATRFYLTTIQISNQVLNTEDFGPWTDLNASVKLRMSAQRQNSPFKLDAQNFGLVIGSRDSLGAQFISDPIAAQTIAGTIKGVIRVFESSATMDARAQMGVYVVSADRATLRGTLLGFDTGALASEFDVNPTLTNRKYPKAWGAPVALTSVNAQDYDRIVIEVGYRKIGVTNTNNWSFEYGDNSATDLAENEVDALQNNPWFEFSDTLTFLNNVSGRRGSSTTNITQLNQKALPPVQSRGDSYEHDGSPIYPSSIFTARRGYKGTHAPADGKGASPLQGEGDSYLEPYPLLSPSSVFGERRGPKGPGTEANMKGVTPLEGQGDSYRNFSPLLSPGVVEGERRGFPGVGTIADLKGALTLQGQGNSYRWAEPRLSVNEVDFRLRPDWRAQGDDLTSGQEGFFGENPPEHYVMKAWNTNLSQYVFWSVFRYPDFTGEFSGYPLIHLGPIAVIGTYD